MNRKPHPETAAASDNRDPVAAVAPAACISPTQRYWIIGATLLTLFLGALDALVMSAAMPTIVSDLGGVNLYSWVFSAYLLSRAVSLPLFGKLADLFSNKILYGVAIGLFVLGSVFCGLSQTMIQLILSRVLQGIGAGGNFALVYIVLSDISSPEKRGKTMSMASFIWGLASLSGPTIGGVIVTYFSWRWIFFFNVPLGGLALVGIFLYLVETRPKRKQVHIDYYGILTLSGAILSLLSACLLAGRGDQWTSPRVLGLLAACAGFSVALYHAEKRSPEPILALDFFKTRAFSVGNGASFLSSFAIFSLFAFSPLFIQGALGKTPMQLGLAMLGLSFGWSVGALFCGQVVHLLRKKPFALTGAVLMVMGCALTVRFSTSTSLLECAVVFGIIGLGMGFVSIPTLLIVQDSLDIADLGVATASHQFARTLGGTVGIGIAGSIVTAKLAANMDGLVNAGVLAKIPPVLKERLEHGLENLFRPEVQALVPPEIKPVLMDAMVQGVSRVFWVALATSVITFLLCWLLPPQKR